MFAGSTVTRSSPVGSLGWQVDLEAPGFSTCCRRHTAYSRAPLSALNYMTNEEPTMTTYQLGRQPARMNFMNKAIARAVKSSAICACLLLFAMASAARASSPDNVVDVIRGARTATSAEVYIVSDIQVPIPISEDKVPSYGCRYSVDQSSMTGLLEIIDKAAIEKSDMHIRQPDLRILIRLHNSDGPFATLAFRRFRSNDDRVHGVVNGVEASAAPDLPERLRAWVAGLAPPTHKKYISCP